MDIIYHAVAGVAISKMFGGSHEIAGAIAAILPDALGTLPYYHYKIQQIPHSSPIPFITHLAHATASNTFSGSVDRIAYQTTHSLVFALLVTAGAFFVFSTAWPVISLSYFSHILIDIPTHDGELATRLLYPFSDLHWKGKNWAQYPRTYLAHWATLLAAMTAYHYLF